MKAPVRIFKPPIEEPLGADFAVSIKAAELNRTGTGAIANVEVWNGAIRHADRLDLSVGKKREDFIAETLRQEPSVDVDALRKVLLELASRLLDELHGPAGGLAPLGASGDDEVQLVKDVVPDAPVPDDAEVPPRWVLSPSGVGRLTIDMDGTGNTIQRLAQVIDTPLVISGRLRDVSENTESLQVSWKRDGRWWTHTAQRSVVGDSRALVSIVSNAGLPVHTGNAKQVVEYLAAFDVTNHEHLVPAQVSSHMGYQGVEGSEGFIWGHQTLRPDDADPEQREVAFRGANDGDEQVADGYYASGTLDGWRDTVRLVANHPKVILGVYASLAAPLLVPLQTPNFAVSWDSPTTGGKTTTQRLAASSWGCPIEESPAAALWGWDMTRAWMERTASTLSGIPLILDDTKRAKKPTDISQFIYDFVAGRGRGRAAITGTRRTLTWRTVLLSSGEVPITSFTEDGGVRTRVLAIWGMPFGARNPKIAELIQKVDAGLAQHFGHAGPAVVRFLLNRRSEWPELREEHRKVTADYVTRAGPNPFASRLASYVATIDIAAMAAHAALELPWDYRDPLETLWADLTKEASDADRARTALVQLLSWAHSHPHDFFGRRVITPPQGLSTVMPPEPEPAERQPNAGWAGRWDAGDEWDFIAFALHRAQELLKSWSFEPDYVLRLWRERGWLRLDPDGQRLYQVRIGDGKSRVVAITREAVREVWEGEG